MLHGRRQVLKGMKASLRRVLEGARGEVRPVNGRPGLVMTLDEHVISVIDLVVTAGRIVEVTLILNPDKLKRVGGQG